MNADARKSKTVDGMTKPFHHLRLFAFIRGLILFAL